MNKKQMAGCVILASLAFAFIITCIMSIGFSHAMYTIGGTLILTGLTGLATELIRGDWNEYEKVCDIQQEIIDALPPLHSIGIDQAVHECNWDKADKLMSRSMQRMYDRIQQIKEARKIIKRIKR